MPSTRPQAAFEPFPPSLDVAELIDDCPNFEQVIRINCNMIDQRGADEFEELLLRHVILGGLPLVIEGYDKKLDRSTFSAKWLDEFWGRKRVDARDLSTGKNIPLSIKHYLRNMPLLTNQWNEKNYKDPHRQRMYLKDMDCHEVWAKKIEEILPPGICYLNEGVESSSNITNDGATRRIGSGRSGDLMSSLPMEMRAENLMCYIGHDGTYTPAHREMCGTLGHNIMVEASADGIEDGQPTRAGSSVWFMTETKDRDVVSEYWLSRLGHDIEIESHFAQINAWKQAPFKVYIVEQKPGDFILIPPLAPHQVWNRGTRTMKVAWNRTTVQTLEFAMNEALFKARLVCRDEQYKTKAIIYYSLQKYSTILEEGEKNGRRNRRLLRDFRKLHAMYTTVLVSEAFPPGMPEQEVEQLSYDSNITCSYCRCNIFNRFLTCPTCIGELADGDQDTYDICLDCYAMGRSCHCISGLRWVEQWPWAKLKDHHSRWRDLIIRLEGKVTALSPKSMEDVLQQMAPRRTLAEICQRELTRRPFHDINQGHDVPNNQNQKVTSRQHLDNNNNAGKRSKGKPNTSKQIPDDHARCHVDGYWEPKWKQATCQKCNKHYCYGILFRAYDEMPQDIIANPDWVCPSCRGICSCRTCSRTANFRRYTPKGTLLGHNTKAVADPRSVESLVDFSQANLAWIQKAGDDHEVNTLRLARKLRQADAAKARSDLTEDDHLITDDEVALTNHQETQDIGVTVRGEMAIDPNLTTGLTPTDNPRISHDEGRVMTNPEQVPEMEDSTNADGSQIHVPVGGLIWDEQTKYELNDAVTYIYPTTVSLNQLQLVPTSPITTSLSRLSIPTKLSKNHQSQNLESRKRKHSPGVETARSDKEIIQSPTTESDDLTVRRSPVTRNKKRENREESKAQGRNPSTAKWVDLHNSEHANSFESPSDELADQPATKPNKRNHRSTIQSNHTRHMEVSKIDRGLLLAPSKTASTYANSDNKSRPAPVRKAVVGDWDDSSDDQSSSSARPNAVKARVTGGTTNSKVMHARK